MLTRSRMLQEIENLLKLEVQIPAKMQPSQKIRSKTAFRLVAYEFPQLVQPDGRSQGPAPLAAFLQKRLGGAAPLPGKTLFRGAQDAAFRQKKFPAAVAEQAEFPFAAGDHQGTVKDAVIYIFDESAGENHGFLEGMRHTV